MASTIETLERDLGKAQAEREESQRAVVRTESAHEAACAARDGAWSESSITDPEVERLVELVYVRRREMYRAIDSLKAAESRERRVKSRLMYVLPAERKRYLSGETDEDLEDFLRALRDAYRKELPGAEITVVDEQPGEMDLGGDAAWRALERLYSETTRRWVEVRAAENAPAAGRLAHQLSFYLGGHVPRLFVGGAELSTESIPDEPRHRPELAGYDSAEGRLALARITVRRYLDESAVDRLGKRPESLIQLAEVSRLYQSMSLTADEVRWRLEQLISLRFEVLGAVHRLTGERRRFSFYEIARAARLLDGHFPDPDVAAEALLHAVDHSLKSGVPLVDVAYMSVTR